MYFTVEPRKGGFRALAYSSGNHKKLFWSEVYTREENAWRAIEIVQREAATAPVYDRT